MVGSSLLIGTLIVAVALYIGLFAFAPRLLILVYFTCYLWAYVGLATSAIVFILALLASRRIFCKRRRRVQLAVQVSAIVFGVVGIGLMVMAPAMSGQSLLMAGYSIHTRIWLDADSVRTWANSLSPSEDPTAAPFKWPLSLMLMSIPAGRVDVDGSGNVTIYRGSALSGHYGVYITARGRDWAGKPWADTSKYDRIKKIEDGVWVWSSMN